MLRLVTEKIAEHRPGGRAPVVILDLDSTLIDTGARHLAIAKAFAADHAELDPVVRDLTPQDFGWDVRDPLREAGVPKPVLDALLAFWSERFFDTDWLHHDLPAPGAVPFVQALADAGAHLAYLTGRPEPTMGPGTRASLKALDFPTGPGTSLRMKPTVALSDARFKRVAIEEIGALGPVAASFENEPAHANAFSDAFPDAVHVLVGDVHDPRAPAPYGSIHRIPDFR